jgi:hypothetical protein
MKPARAWALVGSSRRLDLIDPQPNDWRDRDLAVGLSCTYRWTRRGVFAALAMGTMPIPLLAPRCRATAR